MKKDLYMIGNRPKFMDSPFFYNEKGLWKLRPGALEEVQDEVDEYMKETMIRKDGSDSITKKK